MGYRQDIQAGFLSLVDAATTLTIHEITAEKQLQAFQDAEYVAVKRQEISYQESEYFDGSVQDSTWTWYVYVVSGAGQGTQADKRDYLDTYLTAIEDGLRGEQPTEECTHLYIQDEEAYEPDDFDLENRVCYRQIWRHDRVG